MSELVTELAWQSLRALSATDRAKARAALRWLRLDPRPDGFAKRAAPSPPYRRGTLWASYDDLVITYTIDDAGDVAAIYNVQRAAAFATDD